MPGASGKNTRSKRWAVAVLASALALGPAMAARAAGTGTTPKASGPATPLPLAGTCSVPAGSWPEYQGGPSHAADACSGIDPANVQQLRPTWFVATKGAVTDTPAVAFGSVFAGDYSGLVHAVDQSNGRPQWTFDSSAPQTCFRDATGPYADTHSSGFGRIPASPAAATVGGRRTVFVAAGGSLFALDATTGQCLWAQDTDPGRPTSSIEIESSPVVDTAVTPPEVMVGNDDNSSSGVGVTGLMAFDATSGALLWKYEPERDLTLTSKEFGGSDALTLSCGDGSTNPSCSPAAIPGLAPNDRSFADACGDVWSSPALDAAYADPAGTNTYQGSGATPPSAWSPKQITADGASNPPSAPDGLVVFGTGNCAANPTPATALAHGDYVDNQAVFGLDPVTGTRVWNFVEPYNAYDQNPNEPGAGDDDFGSSPILARLPAGSVTGCPATGTGPHGGTTTLAIEGSKAGYAYGICAANGHDVWSVQGAEAGQLSADLVGALGGFLGSPSMGLSNGRPTVFFTSAVPTGLTNDGIRQPGGSDSNISSCPGTSPAPLLPACPDTSLASDPQRMMSLHAIDAATGKVMFQAPSLPTYAASSYTNGLVLLPDSLAAGVTAYDAGTGTPVWTFPLASVPASAAAVVGDSIYLGTGETDSTVAGQTVPPQLTGIWSFSTTASQVTVTPPSP